MKILISSVKKVRSPSFQHYTDRDLKQDSDEHSIRSTNSQNKKTYTK